MLQFRLVHKREITFLKSLIWGHILIHPLLQRAFIEYLSRARLTLGAETDAKKKKKKMSLLLKNERERHRIYKLSQ